MTSKEIIAQRKEQLTKPYWNYHDIGFYTGLGTTKSIQIKNRAVSEFGGAIRYMSQYVTVDSVMQCLGTTRERELEMLNKALDEEGGIDESC